MKRILSYVGLFLVAVFMFTGTALATSPTITSISPATSTTAGGISVVITGTDFAASTVTFGGNSATTTVSSSTSLTVIVPATSTPGFANVVVTNGDFATTSTSTAFTYISVPTISGVAPAWGPIAGGTSITITGTQFVSGATVKIGGTTVSSTVSSSTTIYATTTATSTSGLANIIVTNTDAGTVSASAFTYVPVGSVRSAVNLGTAGNFAILSKTGITTTGVTAITGDIGSSPIAAIGITGFGLVMDSSNTFSSSSFVTGRIYAADYTAPTPSMMTTAVSDMETAYTAAAGVATPNYTELGSGNIGGMTLAPGVYKWSTDVTIPTDVTLSGSSTAVWIFQIARDLGISHGQKIILNGGALPKNIFWQVGGQTTIGTAAVFNGNILDQTAIVIQTGATLTGRALAQSEVTLDANIVNIPDLSSAKSILSFNIPGQVASTTINEIAHTITVPMASTTVVTSLTPTIVITGNLISPASGVSHNFTSTSTYTVTATDASTQVYVVTVKLLAASSTIPNSSGNATTSSSTPQVVITNLSATTTLTVGNDTVNPTIDIGSFISNGTGTIPAINITSVNAYNTTVKIPASTLITNANAAWNGVMEAPATTTVTLPTTPGVTKTFSKAIELGVAGQTLTFSNAVRILLTGQAGMRAGYSVNGTGSDLVEITNTCATDTQATGNALAAGTECKIDVGSDLVLWTKHFTTFATYSQTTNQPTVYYGGGGGGGGSSYTPPVVATTTATTTASVVIAAPTSIIITTPSVPASRYNFTKDLTIGSTGVDVTALQQGLVNEGYLVMPAGVAYGKFGNLTRDALIKYQMAKGITPAAGYFGAKTRGVINISVVPASQNIASMTLKQLVQMLLQIGAITSDKIDAANKLINSL